MRALLRPLRWLFRRSAGDPATHPVVKAAEYTQGCPAGDCCVIVIRQDHDRFSIFGSLRRCDAAALYDLLTEALMVSATDTPIHDINPTERVQ